MNASSEFNEDIQLNSETDMTTANESGQSSSSGGKKETLLSECSGYVHSPGRGYCVWFVLWFVLCVLVEVGSECTVVCVNGGR